jgi:hypothetical protein
MMLHGAGYTRITRGMMRFFDMDDRARLPWRFFGLDCAQRACVPV